MSGYGPEAWGDRARDAAEVAAMAAARRKARPEGSASVEIQSGGYAFAAVNGRWIAYGTSQDGAVTWQTTVQDDGVF